VDDGDKLDIKIAHLLRQYGFKGIFYIPGNTKLSKAEIRYLELEHEVGSHTLDHLKLSYLDKNWQWEQILGGKRFLERVCFKPVTKFAYPRGWFTDVTKALVKQSGFLEARIMKLGEIDLTGKDKFALPATIHFRPREQHGIADLKNYFHQAQEKDGYFNLVMHGWEIEEFGLWGQLEENLRYINENILPGNRKK